MSGEALDFSGWTDGDLSAEAQRCRKVVSEAPRAGSCCDVGRVRLELLMRTRAEWEEIGAEITRRAEKKADVAAAEADKVFRDSMLSEDTGCACYDCTLTRGLVRSELEDDLMMRSGVRTDATSYMHLLAGGTRPDLREPIGWEVVKRETGKVLGGITRIRVNSSRTMVDTYIADTKYGEVSGPSFGFSFPGAKVWYPHGPGQPGRMEPKPMATGGTVSLNVNAVDVDSVARCLVASGEAIVDACLGVKVPPSDGREIVVPISDGRKIPVVLARCDSCGASLGDDPATVRSPVDSRVMWRVCGRSCAEKIVARRTGHTPGVDCKPRLTGAVVFSEVDHYWLKVWSCAECGNDYLAPTYDNVKTGWATPYCIDGMGEAAIREYAGSALDVAARCCALGEKPMGASCFAVKAHAGEPPDGGMATLGCLWALAADAEIAVLEAMIREANRVDRQ